MSWILLGLSDRQSSQVAIWGLDASEIQKEVPWGWLKKQLDAQELGRLIAQAMVDQFQEDHPEAEHQHLWVKGHWVERGQIQDPQSPELDGWLSGWSVGQLRAPGMGPKRTLAWMRGVLKKELPGVMELDPMPMGLPEAKEKEQWELRLRQARARQQAWELDQESAKAKEEPRRKPGL